MSTYPDIETLHKHLAQCRRCAEAGFRIESTPVVSGKQSARLMVIGQAPGIDAFAPNPRPFGGDSGARLFRWMARVGWSEEEFREKFYITAVTKCFPGSDPKSNGDRVPTVTERRLCRPWLDAELALIQPEVILPVGRLAINLFYPPKLKLVELIGDHKVDEQGRIIVPLPHPSGASRWFNEPRNVARLDLALYRLKLLKEQLAL